jgi:hypothetical protein
MSQKCQFRTHAPQQKTVCSPHQRPELAYTARRCSITQQQPAGRAEYANFSLGADCHRRAQFWPPVRSMFSGCDQRHVVKVLVVDHRLECTPFLFRLI